MLSRLEIVRCTVGSVTSTSSELATECVDQLDDASDYLRYPNDGGTVCGLCRSGTVAVYVGSNGESPMSAIRPVLPRDPRCLVLGTGSVRKARRTARCMKGGKAHGSVGYSTSGTVGSTPEPCRRRPGYRLRTARQKPDGESVDLFRAGLGSRLSMLVPPLRAGRLARAGRRPGVSVDSDALRTMSTLIRRHIALRIPQDVLAQIDGLAEDHTASRAPHT